MLNLRATREYQLPVWEEPEPGSSKAKPNLARPQMHFNSKTVLMLTDPTGLYRTGLDRIEVAFSWPEFIYTAALGYWPEGALFVITPAGDGEKRIVKVIEGKIVDMETGERLLPNMGGHKWGFQVAAERLWSALEFGESRLR